MLAKQFTLAILAVGALATSVVSAEAGRRTGGGGDYVIAQSRQGNGSVRGAVRMTDVGPQVQLPSGSWVYCRRSCSETLRVETVDLISYDRDISRYGWTSNECGIFGCLELNFPRD